VKVVAKPAPVPVRKSSSKKRRERRQRTALRRRCARLGLRYKPQQSVEDLRQKLFLHANKHLIKPRVIKIARTGAMYQSRRAIARPTSKISWRGLIGGRYIHDIDRKFLLSRRSTRRKLVYYRRVEGGRVRRKRKAPQHSAIIIHRRYPAIMKGN